MRAGGQRWGFRPHRTSPPERLTLGRHLNPVLLSPDRPPTFLAGRVAFLSLGRVKAEVASAGTYPDRGENELSAKLQKPVRKCGSRSFSSSQTISCVPPQAALGFQEQGQEVVWYLWALRPSSQQIVQHGDGRYQKQAGHTLFTGPGTASPP